MAIFGYILVMVTILADGTVTGESIDYFKDPNECFQNVLWEEEIAGPADLHGRSERGDRQRHGGPPHRQYARPRNQ